jgi:acetolactate synthase small subunit
MTHTLTALMRQDEPPGALDRIVSLLRRHRARIERMRFCPGVIAGTNRLTVVLDVEDPSRIALQLTRIIGVIEVTRSHHATPRVPHPSSNTTLIERSSEAATSPAISPALATASATADAHHIPFTWQADGVSDDAAARTHPPTVL